MHLVPRLLLASLLLTGSLALRAEDPTPKAPAAESGDTAAAEQDAPKTLGEALARQGIKTTEGPAKVALGSVAEQQLLPGQHFVGPDSIDRFYQLTHNIRGDNEVGVILDSTGWMLFFSFADIGYVKDDDKDKLDADKLLASMREGQDAANEARRKQGWDEMRIVGWANPPHYDEQTHNLTWALKLSSSQDNYQSVWINENIRLLGRGGYMNVILVASPEEYQAASQATGTLLAGNFAYTQGHRYAEWKQGDKIAAVGLSALVLGGGAAVAAKMGWLAKLGGLFAKLGKGVIVIIGAIGAGIAKLFKKISGSHPTDKS